MAEHSELVSEMAILEKLGTQERLKMAKKRRLQQLKKWSQREKEFNNQTKKNKKNTVDLNGYEESEKNEIKKKKDRVHFVPSVMLLEAAARNDIDEVRRLLMMGVNPDSTNEDGLTALHQCCIDDSEEMMKLLIEFGANVNAKDSEKWTPLHACSTCGHLHLVKYLIDKGADLLAVNADNNMPYDICEHEETLDYIEQQMASRGITQQQIDETRSQTEIEMLEFLKQQQQAGVDLNSIKFDFNASALHVAAANGYIQVVEYLLEKNSNVNVNDEDNWQPIHAAACWGHPDVLEILAQAGADLDARTKNGETLFDICEDLELKEQIEQLKSELETKQQLLQQQSINGSRLKRSHSQNTRSQSVRRTSIREKNNTSRREAREEAKIRHHLDDESTKSTQPDANKQQQQNSVSNSTVKSAHLNASNVTTINNVTNVSNVNQSNTSSTSSYPNHYHVNQFNQLNPNNSTVFGQDGGRNSDKCQQQQDKQQMNLIQNNFKDNNYRDRNYGREIGKDGGGKLNQQQQLPKSDAGSHHSKQDTLKLEINMTANHPNDHKNMMSNSTLNNLNNMNNYPTNCSNMNTLSDLKKFRNDQRNRNYINSETMMGKNLFNNNKNNINSSNLATSNLANGQMTGKYNECSMVDGLVNRLDNLNRLDNQNSRFNNNKVSNNHNNNYLNQSPNSTMKKFRGDPSDMIGEMQKRKCCSMM